MTRLGIVFIVIELTLLAALPSFGQALKLDKTISAADLGASTVMPVHCDSAGDVFVRRFQASDGNLPLIKISPDGKLRAVLDIEAAGMKDNLSKLIWKSFAIANDGTAYQLVKDQQGTVIVLKFDTEGRYDKAIFIGKFEPMQIAVFRSGSFLISGSSIVEGALPGSFPLFAGIFDQNGKLVRQIQVISSDSERTGDIKSKAGDRVAYSLPELGIAESDGMNAYLLSQGSKPRVSVVTEAGELDHQIVLDPPNESVSQVSALKVGNGQLMVEYFQPKSGPSGNTTYYLRTYQDRNGELLSEYSRDPEVRGALACTDSRGSFTFLSEDKSGPIMLVARAR